MEYFNKNLFGIDWSSYLTMFPGETGSPTINRNMEVTMLQRLLDQGIAHKEPVILSDFWECRVEEERWRGTWDSYRDHFNYSLAHHKIEHLYFIDLKYRALMLFVSSGKVTDAFKKELEEGECVCHYDAHSRIVSLVSKDQQVEVSAEPREFTEDKDDEEDEKEVEVLDQSVMTIERFYDNLKTLIQTHCRKNKLEYSFMWGLEQEAKDKEMSNFEMIKLLEKLACWVIECPDEETDVVKMDKFQLLMMFNAMVGMIPGYENMKERISTALNVECERDQKVPLALLGRMIVSILDEFST
ncbi:hypothetical protein GCK72_007730 [Caenorhabditis remanei]|uniref:SPK domain-containing protein n=1 Tax=Caenorhabditis remanei TaxID=31234 RepID=A0A6A5HKW4_CAERE|nr:hypothetical protein GCK72_007730 [Caenorhabditis remanei]KAF1767771.1 hypothetical protein GCK72_007730 [Caenorhabditis remanei]